jgi:pimeloyl-ACP methyl ester carboxylesterase
MTMVFIHGVPDTERVWSRLMPLLPDGDRVALSLPGFGCALPKGFGATKEDYVGWLVGALEAIPPPRDLVAHDWGSILLLRVLAERPDLVRSWVGGGAPFTPDYTWHTTARLWQTAGAGEKAMERLTPTLAADMLMRAGLAYEDARETARHIDETMKDCILRLYRSGRDVFETWGAELAPISAPGLVLWGERDAYAAPIFADRIAEMTGAAVKRLDCGHWWQVERPEEAARAIASLWSHAVAHPAP